MKQTTIIMLLLGALPLLIYPIVLLAGVMSLGGHRTGHEPLILLLVVYAVIIASLAYPLVYGACVVGAIVQTRKHHAVAALYCSFGPAGYLLLLVLLFMFWGAIS